MHRLIFILTGAIIVINIRSQELYNIKGVVMRAPVYCGTASLSDKDMEKFRPYPWANKRMFIRQGDSNNLKAPVVKEFITDRNGEFSFSLPAGTYAIIDSSKVDSIFINQEKEAYFINTQYTRQLDEQCLRNWLKKPDEVLKVPVTTVINIIYYDKCSWNIDCVRFITPASGKEQQIQLKRI